MRHLWTDAEVELLTALYPDTKTDQIAALMGIDIKKVYFKANRLGLKKSAAFLASPEARRLDGKIGTHTRFQKGQAAWNNGMKGLNLGGIATQFKPGQVPHTWKPIGSERVSKDGYLQRKVSDTGYPPRDWVGVHIIVWEASNGKVPKGHEQTIAQALRDLLDTIDLHTDCMDNHIDRSALDPWIEAAELALAARDEGWI